MLTKITFLVFGIAMSLLVFSDNAKGQTTITLDPTQDNTLFEDSTLSNGVGAYLFVGTTNQGSNTKRRALLGFDIASAIPAGANITNVTLTLNNSRTISGGQNVGLYKVTKAWGEGTSNSSANGGGAGVTATTGDATWTDAIKGSTTWANAGGDYISTASATTSVAGQGTYTWSSAQMIADVQSWLDSSSTDFGWIVIGNESAGATAKRFDSRENSIVNRRPQLEVTYTLTLNAEKLAKQEAIRVYPNPVQQIINIERATTGQALLALYDQQGRLVQQKEIAATAFQWNVEGVDTGVYILKITEEDKVYREKLLIQN